MKWDEDRQYQGDWINNCLSGFGVFHQNGKIYKGFFECDKKNGIGMLIYANRSYIAGIFEKNRLQGLTIKCSNGKFQVGTTDNNKFIAYLSDTENIIKSEKYKSILAFAESQIDNTENEERI